MALSRFSNWNQIKLSTCIVSHFPVSHPSLAFLHTQEAIWKPFTLVCQGLLAASSWAPGSWFPKSEVMVVFLWLPEQVKLPCHSGSSYTDCPLGLNILLLVFTLPISCEHVHAFFIDVVCWTPHSQWISLSAFSAFIILAKVGNYTSETLRGSLEMVSTLVNKERKRGEGFLKGFKGKLWEATFDARGWGETSEGN